MRNRVPWVGIRVAVGSFLSAWVLVGYFLLNVRVRLANDQTGRIAKWREEALAMKNADGVGRLQMIIQEYPSGTKQSKGSPLDQMVERQRADAIREVLAHLRKETGQNLGDDPTVWIAKYTKN